MEDDLCQTDNDEWPSGGEVAVEMTTIITSDKHLKLFNNTPFRPNVVDFSCRDNSTDLVK